MVLKAEGWGMGGRGSEEGEERGVDGEGGFDLKGRVGRRGDG